MIYVPVIPRRYMLPLIEKLPDLVICYRYRNRWYLVDSPADLVQSKIHEWIMLSVHESFPSGDRWVLIHHDSPDTPIEPFTSDSWDECVLWAAGRFNIASDRKRLENCLRLSVK